MKLLYVTDLHGDVVKYNRVYEIAKKVRPDIVINGGDMLPKSADLFRQGKFISSYLSNNFLRYERAGISFLCLLGNDDLKIFDDLFDKTCRKFFRIMNLAQRGYEIDGFEFIGMNYVADYPFRLKDRCRRDTASYVTGRQFGTALLSSNNGWQEIENWPEYIKALLPLEDELELLPTLQKLSRSVYVIHMPPSKLGLDVCANGERVGSDAVYKFIEGRQPRLTLHGHIHESPEMSGVWKSKIGETVCVQPGQSKHGLTYIIIDLVTMEVNRITE